MRRKPEWHAEALAIAEADPTLTTRDIAKLVGHSHSAVWRALNPGVRVRENQLVNQRIYRRTRGRGTCAECGFPMGIGTKARYKLCEDCRKKAAHALHEQRLRKVERMFLAGRTYREIADRMGWKNSCTVTYYTRILAEQGRIELRGAGRKARAA